MRRFRHLLAIGLGFCLPGTAGAAELTVYTEESAPYHFTQDGEVAGIATDALRLACRRAGLRCTIQMLPWARAYAQTLQRPNTMIYSMVRTPEREKEFIWVSRIATETMWLYGRADSPPLKSLDALKAMRIGVINGSSAVSFLRNAGIPDSALDLANSTETNLRKLEANRIQYLVNTDSRMQKALTRFALPFAVIKRIKLQDASSYYAMNPKSDPALVRRLQQALASVSTDTALADIKAKYEPK